MSNAYDDMVRRLEDAVGKRVRVSSRAVAQEDYVLLKRVMPVPEQNGAWLYADNGISWLAQVEGFDMSVEEPVGSLDNADSSVQMEAIAWAVAIAGGSPRVKIKRCGCGQDACHEVIRMRPEVTGLMPDGTPIDDAGIGHVPTQSHPQQQQRPPREYKPPLNDKEW